MTKMTPHFGFFIVALSGFILIAWPSSLGLVQGVGHGVNEAVSGFFSLMLGQR